MMRAGRALVAIADRENREALIQVLDVCGLEPVLCSTIGEAGALLASEATDVLFCDTGFADGLFDDPPRTMSSGKLRTPMIVCSRLYDPAVYLDVMNRGALDFIVYPYRTDDVKWVVGTALCRSPEPALNSQADARCAIST
jgi:DNA-binding NtrC family response regulator